MLVKRDILIEVIKRAGGIERLKSRFKTIDKWIEGKRNPTVKQLEELSKLSGIPFGDIIIGKVPPPFSGIEITFFRKNPDIPPSTTLEKLVRLIQQRVDFASEYLKNLGHKPLNFVGTATIKDNPKDVAYYIRELLNLNNKWFTQKRTRKETFNLLREKLEEKGVFIFVNSIFEDNTHLKLNSEEFKGFAIADTFAPAIFINSNTYLSTQIFTLIHEFTHILLGESAISQFDEENPLATDYKVEQFCNKVAANVLAPEEILIQELTNRTYDEINKLSLTLGISPIVILIQAKEKGIISQKTFIKLNEEYTKQFREWKEKEEPPKSHGGPSWYVMKKHKLGERFLNIAIEAFNAGEIPPNYFHRLTNLKMNHLPKLQEIIR